MINVLSGLVSKAKLASAGINWTLLGYKILAAGLILLLTGVLAYREGKHDCEYKQSQTRVEGLEKQVVEERQIVINELGRREKNLVERLTKLQQAGLESAKLQADIAQIREDLKDAISKRPGNAACAPSDDELRQYDEIAKRTKRSK